MILLILFTSVLSIPILLWMYSWYIAEIPKYYTKKGTKLHAKVEKNLRILHQLHHPSWWCPFGSAQTVIRELFRACPQLPFEREVVEFEDGGAAGIDWLIPEGADEKAPIVVFLPGIAGSTHDSGYLLHAVMEARDKGWKCLVVNPRGLSGVKLRTTRSYSAAATEDFSFIAEMVHNRFPNARKLGCGFSAGGIILYNYLAKAGENSHIDGGMAVSSPWDINMTSLSLEDFFPNLIFNRFIVKNLVNIVASHQELFENCDGVDFKAVVNSKTLRQFENSFIVPTFKYENCQAYYDDAAMKTKVHQIRRPMVTLNAVDDCFSPIKGIPINDIENSEHVISIITNHGGHTAFMESADPNARGLVEKLLTQWGNLVFHDYH